MMIQSFWILNEVNNDTMVYDIYSQSPSQDDISFIFKKYKHLVGSLP